MTTTADTTTPVRSHQSMTIVVGDDAVISVGHFTDHPTLGSYHLLLNGCADIYLTESSARALVRRLTQAMDAARDGAE
jgi:hypothetical protein